MTMRTAARRTFVIERARELARTGRYRSWHTIEIHLRADGYTEARELLDDADLRRELNGCCGCDDDLG